MKLVNTHTLILFLVFNLLLIESSAAQQWSLQQCLDTAQLQNKNLKIASNNIALSAQKQKEAKSYLIPKLSANGDYKYFIDLPHQLMPLSTFNPAAPEGQFKEAQFGVPHNINANLQLAIPLYNPKIYGGIQASKQAAEMSLLQYEKGREEIYFQISNLYYNAQILQTQIAFLDSNLINANSLLKNLRLLHSQLLVTGTDVEKIQLQVAQLNTQKATISNKLKQVLNTLKFLIGIPEDKDFAIETAIVANKTADYNAQTSLDTRIVNI